MNKIKVLLASIWYPLSISRYFERAFERREDVELRTIGPYTGNKIPWANGMTVPAKYSKSPNYITPMYPTLNWTMCKAQMLTWKPDIIVTADAGIRWDKKPDASVPVCHIATDPHVLNYDVPRQYSDFFFNMQKCYSKPGDIYLPYAFDPTVHYVDDTLQSEDCSLIGNTYPNRVALVNELRRLGFRVNFQLGPIFDEYRQESRKAFIGLNWSSLNDLVARVFEIMAMGLVPVINRVPDIGEFFEDGVDYFGFDTQEECIAQVKYAKDMEVTGFRVRNNALTKMWTKSEQGYPQHSYDQRVYQILKTANLI